MLHTSLLPIIYLSQFLDHLTLTIMLLWATCERRWLRSVVVEAAHTGGGRGGGGALRRMMRSSSSSTAAAVLGSSASTGRSFTAVPQQHKHPPTPLLLRNASTSSRTLLMHRSPPFSCKSAIPTRLGGRDCATSSHSFSAASRSSSSTLSHLRSFSSSSSKEEEEEPQPLVLWVMQDDFTVTESESDSSSSSEEFSSSSEDEDDSSSLEDARPPLVLMPQTITNATLVASADDIVQAVNRHYGDGDSQERFVGGMGEQDPGVWFAPATDDTLETDLLASSQSLELLGDAMERCRAERHGVPFSVHTAGVNVSDVHAVAQLKWHSVHVSLWAATPQDYERATGGGRRPDFGAVCGFIAEAVELGVPVEVAVLREHAGAARDLARSLGARQVHVYDRREEEDY